MIDSRTDNNSVLFVSLNKSHSRFTESGVEKAHPYKFRRTMAKVNQTMVFSEMFMQNLPMVFFVILIGSEDDELKVSKMKKNFLIS